MEAQGMLSQVQDSIRRAASSQETKAMYLAKLVKLQRASDTVAGSIIADTVEISQKAMNKFLSEVKV